MSSTPSNCSTSLSSGSDARDRDRGGASLCPGVAAHDQRWYIGSNLSGTDNVINDIAVG